MGGTWCERYLVWEVAVMESRSREMRRPNNMLRERLPEIGLDRVDDPRSSVNRQWPLSTLLSTAVVGITVGCKGPGELVFLLSFLTKPFR